jgi:hypothetical protein
MALCSDNFFFTNWLFHSSQMIIAGRVSYICSLNILRYHGLDLRGNIKAHHHTLPLILLCQLSQAVGDLVCIPPNMSDLAVWKQMTKVFDF